MRGMAIVALAAAGAIGCSGLRRELRVREDLPAQARPLRRIGIAAPVADVFAYDERGQPLRQEGPSAAAARELARALSDRVSSAGADPVPLEATPEREEALRGLREALRARAFAGSLQDGSRVIGEGSALPGVERGAIPGGSDLLLVTYLYDGAAIYLQSRGAGSQDGSAPPPITHQLGHRSAPTTTVLMVAAVSPGGEVLWTSGAQTPRRVAHGEGGAPLVVEAALGELLPLLPSGAEELVGRARWQLDPSPYFLVSLGASARRVAPDEPLGAISVTVLSLGVRVSPVIVGAHASVAANLGAESDSASMYYGAYGGLSLPVGESLHVELAAEAGRHQLEWVLRPGPDQELLHLTLPYVGARVGATLEAELGPHPFGVWFGERAFLGLWVFGRSDLERGEVVSESGGVRVVREGGGTAYGAEVGLGIGW